MAEYQIRLKDWDGQRIAIFAGTGREVGDLRKFSFEIRLNEPSEYVLEIDGTDERVELFTLDYQVEFWRRDQQANLDWYRAFEAFHRGDEWTQDESGHDVYKSLGQHYNVLLLAEPIRYPAGSIYTQKAGPAETVAKAYVNENIGPGATAPPREIASVMPGLTIEADGATGADWHGARTNMNLLDVLMELGEYAPADFMVVGTGPATFEFQWRSPRWGEDKTWGNAAHRPAVILDPRLGNVRNILYGYDRRSEVNVCYVLGQGQQDTRRVVTRASGHNDDSPWNRRAVARDDSNEYDPTVLERKGDEVLEKERARIVTTCNVAQTEATQWGRDWDLGDLVTFRYRNVSVSQKVIAVRVSVSSGGEETIQAIMENFGDPVVDYATLTPTVPVTPPVGPVLNYLWAQDYSTGYPLYTAAGITALLTQTQGTFTDVMLAARPDTSANLWFKSSLLGMQALLPSGQTVGEYFIEQAHARGMRAHIWLYVGHWAYAAYPGVQASWNMATSADPTCNAIAWVDFSSAAARTMIVNIVMDLIAQNTGIDGVHLDYIRYHDSNTNCPSAALANVTALLTTLKPLMGSVELSVSISGNATRNLNVKRDVSTWLNNELVDKALMMSYVSVPMTEKLAYIPTLPNYDRIVPGCTDNEGATAAERLATFQMQWNTWRAAGYGAQMGVFDTVRLTSQIMAAMG